MEWHGNEQALRALLHIRWGQPDRFDTGLALRLFGQRERIHPNDAIAFRTVEEGHARARAEVNRDVFHHYVFGPMMTEVGWIYVLDLRGEKFRLDSPWTDPREPD